MADSTSGNRIIAQHNGILMPNRAGDRPVQVPADRPGVVIFLHGVNDPGGNYDIIEKGLCEGLNQRLSRKDLRAGIYGATYAKALKSPLKPTDIGYKQVAKVKYDPDTYEYQRTEVTDGPTPTHSMFIPFYWGYRAAPEEITKGQLRGQYQDIHGNRLSKHFAKGGGMFNNATGDIPSMYQQGFYDSTVNQVANHLPFGMGFNDYQFSGTSPDRHYQVLAAERLVTLIEAVRQVDANETITIVGHSQGNMVALLAQALLSERNQRCADCLVMVDPPYTVAEPMLAGVTQPSAKGYTTRSKVNTLINIVKAVTAAPYSTPALDELKPDNPKHGGRTGPGWSPGPGATWTDFDKSTHAFAERDNRGKVYLYFCTEDATVDVPIIEGIGTHGVPDAVTEKWKTYGGPTANLFGPTPSYHRNTIKAMDTLKTFRFHQRLWTKHAKDKNGKSTDVGGAPAYRTVIKGEPRNINGEQISLDCTYTPNLYGGEAIQGTPDKPGYDRPDTYTQDLALGNRHATMSWKKLPAKDVPADVQKGGTDAVKAWYNSRFPDPEDHTFNVIAETYNGIAYGYEREETPNEARERMATDRHAWEQNENSYHSAILRDANNLRRVAAYDVAIGQAKTLDDPDWRELFIAIADWKTPFKNTLDAHTGIGTMAKFGSLSPSAQKFIKASCDYYANGTFPLEFVSRAVPPLVDHETENNRYKDRS